MWITIGLLRLVALLPYTLAIGIGKLLGNLVYHLSRKRRAVVDINLELCFPQKSRAERARIKREAYRNFGVGLIEMAICWWWPDRRLEPLVEIEGKEHLDAVLDSGRGAILLSGHFTSLEIGGRLLSMYLPFQTIYRTQRNALFDSYLYTRRSSYLQRVVSRKDMRRLIKGIREGIPTWYAPDQDFRRERNVFAPFMGVPAATITAGSRLAEATGAAMLPYYPQRRRDGSGYLLIIGKPLENFPSGDEVADATAINASIGEFIRMDPGNYMWIHERFKTRPPGEDPVYP
jgi:KDO2-lipid IV(A) lauroyltransferase